MLEKLEEIIKQSNPNYVVDYEESSMMNVKADEMPVDRAGVYIEEFRRGKFVDLRFREKAKQVVIQIYFFRFVQFQNNAIEREKVRERIENEIVLPFIENYNNSSAFESVPEFGVHYPMPRFDANEVSVMLEFNCIMKQC